MSCQLCSSSNETELSAEMVIKNLDKHGVWVFAKFLVCLDCGCSHFTVPEEKLASIAHTLELGSSPLEWSTSDVAPSGGEGTQVGSRKWRLPMGC